MPQKRNTDKSTDKRLQNLRAPWKKGESGNPHGRRKGQRDYATIYREALIKIAEADGLTPDEIETRLEEVGLRQALENNFQFWKDIRDRIHGQPVKRTELTGKDGQPIEIAERDLIEKALDDV